MTGRPILSSKGNRHRDAKANLVNDANAMDNVICWHRRMGHLNVRELIKCCEDKSVRGIDLRRIDSEFEKFGAKKTVADMCVYVKGSGESFMIVTIFVDDMIASKDAKSTEKLKKHLGRRFDIIDREEIKYCLRMEFFVKEGEVSIR